MKRVNWVLVLVVLVGFVLGGGIGTYFSNTFLNYGQMFGLTSPAVLNLGFFVITFGFSIHITIASILGVVIALIVYRLLR